MAKLFKQPSTVFHNRVPEIIFPLCGICSTVAERDLLDLLRQVNNLPFVENDEGRVSVMYGQIIYKGNSRIRRLVGPIYTFVKSLTNENRNFMFFNLKNNPPKLREDVLGRFSTTSVPFEYYRMHDTDSLRIQPKTTRVRKISFIPSYFGYGRKFFYENDFQKFDFSLEETLLILSSIFGAKRIDHFKTTQYYQYCQIHHVKRLKPFYSFNLAMFAFYIYNVHLSCLAPYSEKMLTEKDKDALKDEILNIKIPENHQASASMTRRYMGFQRRRVQDKFILSRKIELDDLTDYTPDEMPQICGKGEIFIIDNLLKATFETEESGQKMITDILRFYSDGPITFGELSHVKP